MGLAASQARFLAITSRKMNCEFQSMQIAQQKLSVTRDLQKAAQDYQTSLSASKLVWDTKDDDVYDLSYDVMMKPSGLNEYDPYLITDSRGRIVLTESMFAAAKEAGVINENGDPTGKMFKGSGTDSQIDGSRDAFLYQMGIRNQIDASTVNAIYGLGINGYTKSGVGGDVIDKTQTNAFTTAMFIKRLKEETYGSLNKGDTSIRKLTPTESAAYPIKLLDDSVLQVGDKPSSAINVEYKSIKEGGIIDTELNYKLPDDTTFDYEVKVTNADSAHPNLKGTYAAGETVPAGAIVTLEAGSVLPFALSYGVQTALEAGHNEDDLIYDVDLASVLNDKYNANNKVEFQNNKFLLANKNDGLTSDELKNVNIGEILEGQYSLSYKGNKADFTAMVEKVIEELASKLGWKNSGSGGLCVDVESQMALEQAMEFTKLQIQKTTTSSNESVWSLNNAAKDYNTTISGRNNTFSISLTNLMKTFLTNFAIAIDGYNSDFRVKDKIKDSKYVTSDPTYYFLLQNNGAMTDRTMLNADFYNMLYNQLAMNGACTDKNIREMVTDKSYLTNALKNGQLFVSSLNNDGYFYQGHYTLNGHIEEIPDEAAIAQAEVEYNVTKGKLNYKEQTLELQMKNLDMEISSLTTEFDTVKNLISKNVEKVFTMFSS